MPRQITVDFAGVESGGSQFIKIPEGDYGFEITVVKQKKSQDKNQPYLEFDLKTNEGNPKGLKKTLKHRCSLQKQALWNLRNLIEACGKNVASKAVKIDLDKMIGWKCAGTVIDGDEYNGRKRSTISAFFPVEDLVPWSEESGSKDGKTEEAEEEEESSSEEEEELFS